MLRRKPTRVELKPEDREELEAIKRERQAAARSGAHQDAGFSTPPPDQVEVKLRLPSRDAYDAVAAAMAPSLKATHRQENYFFDGPSQELTSKHGVLRVRFYDIDRKALVTLKGRQQLEGGVGRGTEVEFCADPAEARRWLTSPAGLLAADSDVVRSAKAEYGLTDLVCMGGFKNLRQDYAFEGHTLELDETTFDHGTVHEIEVESAEPEKVQAKLEAFLKGRGIPFSYSKSTKFANWIHKTLV